MSYVRVIPRDLFNESKLLKCLGQLALLIHDGLPWPPGSRALPSPWIKLEHFTEINEGFSICQDETTGGLYCNNVTLVAAGVEVPLRSIYNSHSNYPLVFATVDRAEELVFDERGKLSTEFKAYMQSLTTISSAS